MKREYPDAPLIGVGAIIIEQDRVILVKRAHPPLLGEWSIPGGMLEVGETLRQAAVREVLEETGLRVEVGELLGVFDRIVQDADGRTLYHYVLIDYLCRRIAGEPQPACDAAEARWFNRDDVGELSLPEDTAEVVRLGFEKSVSESDSVL
jgi:8-oxo-dGTP diphosphatase